MLPNGANHYPLPDSLPHGVVRARAYEERDLSMSSDSPPDSPPDSEQGDSPPRPERSVSAVSAAASKGREEPAKDLFAFPKISIRRSLSWGKKRQKKKKSEKQIMKELSEAMTADVPPFETEHVVVTIDRGLATTELGLALHPISEIIAVMP